MKETNHRFYVIENNDIPDTELDLNISSDMYFKDYYKNSDTEITDISQDGWLNLNTGKYSFDFPCDVNERNITVLRHTYEKLAYIVFCLVYYSYTREEIDIVTQDIIRDFNEKDYVPGFQGFTFNKIKEVQIGTSRFYVPIDYKDKEEVLYDCSHKFNEYCFTQHYKEYNLNLADIAVMKKYTIVIDDMEDNYFRRMLDDVIIDKTNKRILCFSNIKDVEVIK